MPANSIPISAQPGETTPALLTMPLIRKHYVPMGERTLWRWISTGQFPPADLTLGAKVRLWRRETIEKWIDENATGGGK